MPLPLFQVDAFTDEAFRGNPAAVCLLDAAAPEAWMQAVAAEMNLSETAFVMPHADGFQLRWFTPTVEVDLCGHATLASAHTLWEAGRLGPDSAARFHTRSGLLTATLADGSVTLDFPASRTDETEMPDGLDDALGVAPQRVVQGAFDYLVEVESETDVHGLDPDFRALGEIDVERGIVVTARGEGEVDFVSRFFAPAAGVDEDPVTGSVHCLLAPYWAERLGRADLVGYQASQRGGTVRVGVRGDRVLLGGQAVTVFQGTLLTEPA
ncbi:MAG: PhzF family phenazine biosynthesis protein [Bacteroidota bacterium]